ncbi:hypothetical protein EC538_05730 [Helicobacter pylori]|nr:hypothetical protein EC538_05730 [Helicobacter pylori]
MFCCFKKKKGFLGCFGTILNIKKVLKFVLIKDSDKMGVWLLGGIVLDLVVKLLRGYFKWDRFRLGCKTLKGVF